MLVENLESQESFTKNTDNLKIARDALEDHVESLEDLDYQDLLETMEHQEETERAMEYALITQYG